MFLLHRLPAKLVEVLGVLEQDAVFAMAMGRYLLLPARYSKTGDGLCSISQPVLALAVEDQESRELPAQPAKVLEKQADPKR